MAQRPYLLWVSNRNKKASGPFGLSQPRDKFRNPGAACGPEVLYSSVIAVPERPLSPSEIFLLCLNLESPHPCRSRLQGVGITMTTATQVLPQHIDTRCELSGCEVSANHGSSPAPSI